MGFLDELKKLTQPFDDDDGEFFDSEEDLTRIQVGREAVGETAVPRKASFFSGGGGESSPVRPSTYTPRSAGSSRSTGGGQDFGDAGSGKVVNLSSSSSSSQLKVVLAKPKVFDKDANKIADHLRDKNVVVINLEETDKAVARRLLDFLSGVAYAQDGDIKNVASNTYIITPYNVDLMDENAMDSIMGDLESSNFSF